MTLEEAIKHAEEKAQEQRDNAVLWDTHPALKERVNACLECAKDHEQLAEWLKELKRYRECGCIRMECTNCGGCDNGR